MRKTSTEYTKELKDLRTRTSALESRIKDRLLRMVESFPEAIVDKKDGVEMKARSITTTWLDTLPTEDQLKYISAIEQHNLKQEKVQQISWI